MIILKLWLCLHCGVIARDDGSAWPRVAYNQDVNLVSVVFVRWRALQKLPYSLSKVFGFR
jgi:hypothetical protein